MMALESKDWDELIKFLQDAEEGVSAVVTGDAEKEIERSHRSVVSFYTTAATLGLGGVGEGRTRTREIPDRQRVAGCNRLYCRTRIRSKLGY